MTHIESHLAEEPASHQILNLVGISKNFGGLKSLDDVSFSIGRRSIVALIGPNGAGKTTLFNVITGVLQATAGRVIFKDADITSWRPNRIAEAGLARTFQNVELFNTLNVLENVIAARYSRTRSSVIDAVLMTSRDRTYRRNSRDNAMSLLESVGFRSKPTSMPRDLPYGDQRRLEIARALATDPDMIVLDEPCAGMVASEVDEVIALVASLRDSGKTILLVEHNMAFVMSIASKIVVLNFGRTIAHGTPSEIRTNEAVIDAYLGRGT